MIQPGDWVQHRHLRIAGLVTEVRPTGVGDAWTLVEFRFGEGDDETYCDVASMLAVVDPPSPS